MRYWLLLLREFPPVVSTLATDRPITDVIQILCCACGVLW
jgi:hypothetical protein